MPIGLIRDRVRSSAGGSPGPNALGSSSGWVPSAHQRSADTPRSAAGAAAVRDVAGNAISLPVTAITGSSCSTAIDPHHEGCTPEQTGLGTAELQQSARSHGLALSGRQGLPDSGGASLCHTGADSPTAASFAGTPRHPALGVGCSGSTPSARNGVAATSDGQTLERLTPGQGSTRLPRPSDNPSIAVSDAASTRVSLSGGSGSGYSSNDSSIGGHGVSGSALSGFSVPPFAFARAHDNSSSGCQFGVTTADNVDRCSGCVPAAASEPSSPVATLEPPPPAITSSPEHLPATPRRSCGLPISMLLTEGIALPLLPVAEPVPNRTDAAPAFSLAPAAATRRGTDGPSWPCENDRGNCLAGPMPSEEPSILGLRQFSSASASRGATTVAQASRQVSGPCCINGRPGQTQASQPLHAMDREHSRIPRPTGSPPPAAGSKAGDGMGTLPAAPETPAGMDLEDASGCSSMCSSISIRLGISVGGAGAGAVQGPAAREGGSAGYVRSSHSRIPRPPLPRPPASPELITAGAMVSRAESSPAAVSSAAAAPLSTTARPLTRTVGNPAAAALHRSHRPSYGRTSSAAPSPEPSTAPSRAVSLPFAAAKAQAQRPPFNPYGRPAASLTATNTAAGTRACSTGGPGTGASSLRSSYGSDGMCLLLRTSKSSSARADAITGKAASDKALPPWRWSAATPLNGSKKAGGLGSAGPGSDAPLRAEGGGGTSASSRTSSRNSIDMGSRPGSVRSRLGGVAGFAAPGAPEAASRPPWRKAGTTHSPHSAALSSSSSLGATAIASAKSLLRPVGSGTASGLPPAPLPSLSPALGPRSRGDAAAQRMAAFSAPTSVRRLLSTPSDSLPVAAEPQVPHIRHFPRYSPGRDDTSVGSDTLSTARGSARTGRTTPSPRIPAADDWYRAQGAIPSLTLPGSPGLAGAVALASPTLLTARTAPPAPPLPSCDSGDSEDSFGVPASSWGNVAALWRSFRSGDHGSVAEAAVASPTRSRRNSNLQPLPELHEAQPDEGPALRLVRSTTSAHALEGGASHGSPRPHPSTPRSRSRLLASVLASSALPAPVLCMSPRAEGSTAAYSPPRSQRPVWPHGPSALASCSGHASLAQQAPLRTSCSEGAVVGLAAGSRGPLGMRLGEGCTAARTQSLACEPTAHGDLGGGSLHIISLSHQRLYLEEGEAGACQTPVAAEVGSPGLETIAEGDGRAVEPRPTRESDAGTDAGPFVEAGPAGSSAAAAARHLRSLSGADAAAALSYSSFPVGLEPLSPPPRMTSLVPEGNDGTPGDACLQPADTASPGGTPPLLPGISPCPIERQAAGGERLAHEERSAQETVTSGMRYGSPSNAGSSGVGSTGSQGVAAAIAMWAAAADVAAAGSSASTAGNLRSGTLSCGGSTIGGSGVLQGRRSSGTASREGRPGLPAFTCRSITTDGVVARAISQLRQAASGSRSADPARAWSMALMAEVHGREAALCSASAAGEELGLEASALRRKEDLQAYSSSCAQASASTVAADAGEDAALQELRERRGQDVLALEGVAAASSATAAGSSVGVDLAVAALVERRQRELAARTSALAASSAATVAAAGGEDSAVLALLHGRQQRLTAYGSSSASAAAAWSAAYAGEEAAVAGLVGRRLQALASHARSAAASSATATAASACEEAATGVMVQRRRQEDAACASAAASSSAAAAAASAAKGLAIGALVERRRQELATHASTASAVSAAATAASMGEEAAERALTERRRRALERLARCHAASSANTAAATAGEEMAVDGLVPRCRQHLAWHASSVATSSAAACTASASEDAGIVALLARRKRSLAAYASAAAVAAATVAAASAGEEHATLAIADRSGQSLAACACSLATSSAAATEAVAGEEAAGRALVKRRRRALSAYAGNTAAGSAAGVAASAGEEAAVLSLADRCRRHLVACSAATGSATAVQASWGEEAAIASLAERRSMALATVASAAASISAAAVAASEGEVAAASAFVGQRRWQPAAYAANTGAVAATAAAAHSGEEVAAAATLQPRHQTLSLCSSASAASAAAACAAAACQSAVLEALVRRQSAAIVAHAQQEATSSAEAAAAAVAEAEALRALHVSRLRRATAIADELGAAAAVALHALAAEEAATELLAAQCRERRQLALVAEAAAAASAAAVASSHASAAAAAQLCCSLRRHRAQLLAVSATAAAPAAAATVGASEAEEAAAQRLLQARRVACAVCLAVEARSAADTMRGSSAAAAAAEALVVRRAALLQACATETAATTAASVRGGDAAAAAVSALVARRACMLQVCSIRTAATAAGAVRASRAEAHAGALLAAVHSHARVYARRRGQLQLALHAALSAAEALHLTCAARGEEAALSMLAAARRVLLQQAVSGLVAAEAALAHAAAAAEEEAHAARLAARRERLLRAVSWAAGAQAAAADAAADAEADALSATAGMRATRLQACARAAGADAAEALRANHGEAAALKELHAELHWRRQQQAEEEWVVEQQASVCFAVVGVTAVLMLQVTEAAEAGAASTAAAMAAQERTEARTARAAAAATDTAADDSAAVPAAATVTVAPAAAAGAAADAVPRSHPLAATSRCAGRQAVAVTEQGQGCGRGAGAPYGPGDGVLRSFPLSFRRCSASGSLGQAGKGGHGGERALEGCGGIGSFPLAVDGQGLLDGDGDWDGTGCACEGREVRSHPVEEWSDVEL